ncbi:aryl-sulfate sulfotransferase [Prolixibacteraceae bacterium]|nr:aryl-sulfate sulfotransferase [Prolixibacteraceae bacterium]
MINYNKVDIKIITLILILMGFIAGCEKDHLESKDSKNPPNEYFASTLDESLIHGEDKYNAIFIENVSFSINQAQYNALDHISFEILPKEGSTIVEPLKGTYTKHYIETKGFLDKESMLISFPIFGLYDAYKNRVRITSMFSNNRKWEKVLQIETKAYEFSETKNTNIFANKQNFVGESYIHIVTDKGPMIMDIEGNIRWAYEDILDLTCRTSALLDKHMYCKQKGTPFDTLLKLGFDGTQEIIPFECGHYSGAAIHHEINLSPNGLLLEIHIKDGTTLKQRGSVLIEVDKTGKLLQSWDMDEIIGSCLTNGELPIETFIRNHASSGKALDWFHMNSSTYDKHDNSILISSRENFVIKVGYSDKQVKWILGDPTKFWHTLAPLNKYALKLTDGNINIGQHSLNFLKDGELLMFNNGENSTVPYFPKEKLGATFSKSMISAYQISNDLKQAKEVIHIELPYFCPNRGFVRKCKAGFLVDYIPQEPDFNSVIAIYNEQGKALLEIINHKFFATRAFPFPNEIVF